VPGLIDAAYHDQVTVLNRPGCRALETPALLAFLQPLCRHLLGEDLLLPNAATWWCGQDAPRRYVLDNLGGLVIKPTFRTRDSVQPRFGAHLSRGERSELVAEIRAHPEQWCGQERIFHSTTPGWYEGRLRPMPFITRLYVAWHDGDYRVMPGGLTRCNPRGEDMIVSLQQGSVSKDTWVLHEDAAPPAPAIVKPSSVGTVRHTSAAPSRTADNLFWFGRYLERAAALARRLEKLDGLMQDEIALLDPDVPRDALGLLFQMQALVRPENETLWSDANWLRTAAEDANQPSSLAGNVAHLARLLETLKAQLPHEAWQSARQLRQRRQLSGTARLAGLSQQLNALEALTLETMAHDTGWHFLQLGRHLERAGLLLQLISALLPATEQAAPTEFRLNTLLYFADTLFAYRRAYLGTVEPASVMDWLIVSTDNPRGLRHQVDRLADHLDALPDRLAPRAVAALRLQSHQVFGEVRLADPVRLASNTAETEQLFQGLRDHLSRLSNELDQIYFSHAQLH